MEMEQLKPLSARRKLDWPTWISLSTLGVEVDRSKNNLMDLGILQDNFTRFESGVEQDTGHLLNRQSSSLYSMEHLTSATPNVSEVAEFWSRVKQSTYLIIFF